MGRLSWRLATVAEVRPENARVVTLALEVPGGHLPGQHVDVRLTAEDGYQAERGYSIASAPDGSRVELTVERLEDGEVSPYLAGEPGRTSSSCAAPSAATSSGSRTGAGRCCWSPAGRGWCR